MAKRFLVTGGTGFIGSAAVKRLLKDGYEVRVLDNNIRGANRRLESVQGEFEFFEADVRDAAAVTEAAKGCDSILHLAYINGTQYFYSKPELVLDVAIRGMLAVLDAARANDIGDLVLASSSEVYQTPPTIPTAEDVPLVVPDILNPRYSYGGGKIACELMAINYGRTGFDRVSIFRPHNVYGPDMGWEHVIPQFIERASTLNGGAEFPIQGDGSETRAFIYVDDFTDGLVNVVEKGKHLEIYHIGNPVELSVRELAEEVLKAVGADAQVVPGELLAGSTKRRCPDITKLRELGFSPSVSITDGLKPTVEWYTNNLHLKKELT